MPLGAVLSSEFEKELERLCVVPTNEKVILIERGRGSRPEVPDNIRKLIASEAISGAPAALLAETFNVSESSVSAYKHNATSTSTYHTPNEPLKTANDAVKTELSGRAQNKLKEALDAIVFREGIKPQTASAIARDMSNVMKNLSPEIGIQVNNQQVIVYKPRMKEEDDYEQIQVVE